MGVLDARLRLRYLDPVLRSGLNRISSNGRV